MAVAQKVAEIPPAKKRTLYTVLSLLGIDLLLCWAKLFALYFQEIEF